MLEVRDTETLYFCGNKGVSECLKSRTKVERVWLDVRQKLSVADNGRLIIRAVSDKFKLKLVINYIEAFHIQLLRTFEKW